MADPSNGMLDEGHRANWVRLRTLIVLRWIAIGGQIAAIIGAVQFFGLQLEIGLCVTAIGAAVIANVVAIFVFPETTRLSEKRVAATLLFDILQLSALLYLTGGLNNPFALLILAPVTISATALSKQSTLLLGSIAVLMITLLARYHHELQLASGEMLHLPDLFIFGFWAAIVIGLVFVSAYARRVTSEIHSMSEALLATQMALAREQKLTDLGGVVAAAAHELGTPLATIKLTSAELIEDLSDRPELQEDAALIREQADRCRDILRSMGQAGKDDLHLRRAPLGAVVREAAEPHLNRGKIIEFTVAAGPGQPAKEPIIARRPEIIHGLRNLIQNAVDFAQTTVWIGARWHGDRITISIIDDGPGYSPQVMGRIGDPFVRRRRTPPEASSRPGYEGMGLGLFIAKTLLERSGAELTFANGHDPAHPTFTAGDRSGAIVEVTWSRRAVVVEGKEMSLPLGENRPIEV
ncbi:MAG: ActS/PrrB/RegB family redox-sensitive histidine kinase [Rhodobacteraceae bacterium]|nr:ActS/PrrB/RegB family redox-sensitive histidine kinase [Paracoccaceae bacterium]